MRKNMEAVLKAFQTGQAKGVWGESCSTDGRTVYSYTTRIAFRGYNGDIVLNSSHYSHTTTVQQNSIRYFFRNVGVKEIKDEKVFNRKCSQNWYTGNHPHY